MRLQVHTNSCFEVDVAINKNVIEFKNFEQDEMLELLSDICLESGGEDYLIGALQELPTNVREKVREALC